jgi:hypothetical protein
MLVDLNAEEIREIAELLEEEIVNQRTDSVGNQLLNRLKHVQSLPASDDNSFKFRLDIPLTSR